MNILFYIPDLDKNAGGIYQYSLGVLESISELKENRYYIYHPNKDEVILNLINSKPNLILIEKKESSFSRRIRYIQSAYNVFADLKNKKESNFFKTIVDRLIIKFKIDVVHSPFQFLPEYKMNIPGVSTMHDVQEIKFPEFFSSKIRASRALNYNRTINRSTKIVVSYEHIKQDLIKYFNKNQKDIEVCKISMQNLWFENTKSIEKLKIDDQLFDEYILYPAATWKHKNHLNLLKSLVFLNEKGVKVNLICTGNKKDYFQVINNFINDNKLNDQVKFLGAVSEELLLHLYQNCNAVVVPTLYEAGSFPLMESIMQNIPVICSNVTSLPDTMGNSEFVFDPNKIEDIASKINLIVKDDSYIEKNKTNNLKQKEILLSNNFSVSIQGVYEMVTKNEGKNG